MDEAALKNQTLQLTIADPAVRALPICECGEAAVDLLKVNHPRIVHLSTFDQRYQTYYDKYSHVRAGVYERLLKLLEGLPEGVGLAYLEGFRPLAQQKAYFDAMFRDKLAELGDKEAAYEATCVFISPFIENIPVHCTGAAIDMTLFDKTGLMDLGHFDVVDGIILNPETFSEHVTALQREHRMLLLEAATQAGLVNYGYEWWHFSYGDKPWAYVTGKTHAIYGPMDGGEDPMLEMTKAAYFAEL